MSSQNTKHFSRALTIAGSDSGGGAGIQADLKTFTVLGCYGTSVITALTAQNTLGVSAIAPIDALFITEQINAVWCDIGADAIKLGMLHNTQVIKAVAQFLKSIQKKIPIVLDPVMIAKGGSPLLEPSAISLMQELLFPHITLLTPNVHEAEYLLETKIMTLSEMEQAATLLAQKNAISVLVKGGHLESEDCTDYFYSLETKKGCFLTKPRVVTKNTHGTGCTLSAAITSYLAKGCPLETAISKAKEFLYQAIVSGAEYSLGKGHGPVNHLWDCSSGATRDTFTARES